MVLRVVRNEGENVDRVAVAIAHIESAIAHINNAAQGALSPDALPVDLSRIEQLRLIVVALGDIRESLRALDGTRLDET
jgi:hypothetical protein